jgi:hypothetical protein
VSLKNIGNEPRCSALEDLAVAIGEQRNEPMEKVFVLDNGLFWICN